MMKSVAIRLRKGVDKMQTKTFLKTALSLLGKKKNRLCSDQVKLPDELWERIFEHCSPYDLLIWRRVCIQFHTVISQKFRRVIYLDVCKLQHRFDVLFEKGFLNDMTSNHQRSQIFIKMNERKITLAVFEWWTPCDVALLFDAVSFFGKAASTVTMDISILEMIASYLSAMQNQRISRNEIFTRNVEQDVLLPNLKEITIRISLWESFYLSRVVNYDLDLDRIFDRRDIFLCRICLLISRRPRDINETIALKKINENLNNFKRWLDTDSLKQRYCQNYVQL